MRATVLRRVAFAVKETNFRERVLASQVPVVLDCMADWCAPCKQTTPILEKAVAKQQGRVALGLLDVDAEQELAGQLGVRSLPTVFGVRAGRVVDQFVGGQSLEFVDAFVARLAGGSLDITEADFETLLKSPEPVVLGCYADSCRDLGPQLQKAAGQTKVRLALLDTASEPALAKRLAVRSVPTVFGIVEGRLVETFVGAQTDSFVSDFVERVAAHHKVPEDGLALGRRLVDEGRPCDAIDVLNAAYEDLKKEETSTKRKLPKEYDDANPDAATLAWCLEARARAELDAQKDATHTIAALRDPKRASVLDKNPDIKKAVANLQLRQGAPGDALDAARAAFAAGHHDQAIQTALDLVADAPDQDTKDQARKLVVTFIDALGPSPAATNARKRLANALFR